MSYFVLFLSTHFFVLLLATLEPQEKNTGTLKLYQASLPTLPSFPYSGYQELHREDEQLVPLISSQVPHSTLFLPVDMAGATLLFLPSYLLHLVLMNDAVLRNDIQSVKGFDDQEKQKTKA
ncbi:uncharacterized protein LOC144291792 [Canis aureus]